MEYDGDDESENSDVARNTAVKDTASGVKI